ncbi:hypothetical protein GOBAR_AA20322 [Gossypium barbadense]|uniref:AP2/ERF domain-containing protein n=1 Tax=Gossypium barbadense TaxID=3634 RepID=A0A2P5XAK1_GOSBA|nr:hypothetical protein GOBAR_AA20322 [Gossypium barbadense]
MEIVTAKSEFSPGRTRLCTAEDNAIDTNYIKRRRRDHSNSALGLSNQQQRHQQLQGDQPTATTVKRSSRFRGVSRHRWTGRFEAHLWDKGSWNPTQRKKGKQGAYDEEESAARAYDLAAIKYWGTSTFTNFPVSDYGTEIEIMRSVTKEEYLNLNANYDQTEEKDVKEAVDKNGRGEMLCNEVDGGVLPFMCSNNRGLESKESKVPLYNKTGQSMWNGALNLLTNA